MLFAETHDSVGPLGAKSMSESPFNPVAAALGNAIRDATGIAAHRDALRGRQDLPGRGGRATRGSGMDMKREAAPDASGILERTFRLAEHGTSVRTELLAGLTTFLTMAYIVFINPSILADAGMPRGAVFVATCLVGGARHR